MSWPTIEAATAGHVAFGCACCAPHGPVARALGALWVAAARNGRDLPGVAVPGVSTDDLRAALDRDVLCASRFRIVTTV